MAELKTVRLREACRLLSPLAVPAYVRLPNVLVYSNLEVINPDFGLHLRRDIYRERDAAIADISLGLLPAGAMLLGGTWFAVQVGDALIEEHVAPFLRDGITLSQAIQTPRETVEVAGSVVLAVRYGITTWGHWLAEILPWIVLTERAYPLRFKYVVPQWGTTEEWGEAFDRALLSSLRFYGFPNERLIMISPFKTYRFAELSAVTPIWSDHVMHPQAMEAMRITARRPPRSPFGERIALLRSPVKGRRLENKAQVYGFLAHRGFNAVDVGDLPFEDQVSAFMDARTVFSVLGSDLSGLLYSPDHVRVISAAPSSFGDRFFYALMQLRAGRYADLRGPVSFEDPRVHSNSWGFRLDLGQVAAGLAAFAG